MPRFRWLVMGICILAVSTHSLVAQSVSSSRIPLPQEGVFLVFPFENTSPNARLDWIGEGLEELTIQRLSRGRATSLFSCRPSGRNGSVWYPSFREA